MFGASKQFKPYVLNNNWYKIVCSGQDLGNAVWPILSTIASQASFIKVRGGIITVGSSLQSQGKSVLELSGKSALGRGGALQLAQILAESATPSLLTALDIRFSSSGFRSDMLLLSCTVHRQAAPPSHPTCFSSLTYKFQSNDCALPS